MQIQGKRFMADENVTVGLQERYLKNNNLQINMLSERR